MKAEPIWFQSTVSKIRFYTINELLYYFDLDAYKKPSWLCEILNINCHSYICQGRFVQKTLYIGFSFVANLYFELTGKHLSGPPLP